MDTTADCFYNDRPKLNAALAETVNKEILSLVEAGCKLHQIKMSPVCSLGKGCTGLWYGGIREMLS